MSTQTEIIRLQNARDSIRAKLVELGIGLTTDKIDSLATKMEANLVNRGSVQANVKEGESYTIEKGYHDGTGTVIGVAGGGSYSLQTKTVTPTKAKQEVTSDSGYYGLSGVTVNAIPQQYQDVSGTTATAADVLATKIFTTADGTKVAGTMPNNDEMIEYLSPDHPSITIPMGYHSGTGEIFVTVDAVDKVIPTTEEQEISASGAYMETVTVAAIPSKYKDTSTGNATSADILSGKIAFNSSGKVTGGMTNNGAVSLTMDGLSVTSVTVPAGYHNGSGTISLTNDIETALAAI